MEYGVVEATWNQPTCGYFALWYMHNIQCAKKYGICLCLNLFNHQGIIQQWEHVMEAIMEYHWGSNFMEENTLRLVITRLIPILGRKMKSKEHTCSVF
jgi:hypothetical protein